ncbi:MAG: hypothetical protein KF730_12205 [Sphingomonas sp.]|uniref:hypothetical protein n=1 Tax=Sphingomonas sp. TaxID=28214 RepID=UPI0025E621E9|nr:hypothetical protein [Sphingomonas sp.]MBX3565323.1 hypothetical protein [Sphingomonas sp.]
MRILLAAAPFVVLMLSAGQAQISKDPDAHEALAAKLVSVLPPSGNEQPGPDPLAATRAADITKAHPAKSAAIAAAFADRVRCSSARRDETVSRLLLAVTRKLTDDELRAMIAFYTGPDLAAAEKAEDGSPEMEALMRRYPLKRFGEVMQTEMSTKMFDEVMAAEDACEAGLTETLAKQGIEE